MRLIRLLAALLVVTLLMLTVSVAFGIETVTLDEGVPQEVLAVQVLIDQFGDQRLVVWPDPIYEMKPAYAALAEAAGSFGECAVDPLTEALSCNERQVCIAAAIGLEAVGPAAIRAEPVLREMLTSPAELDQKLACGVIRGIGPGAVDLVPELQTLLGSDNFHVQYWACRGLASIGPGAEDSVPTLLDLLETGVASVRRNAALTLGSIAAGLTPQEQEPIICRLTMALEDRMAGVRDAAKEALETIKAKPVC